MSRERIDLSNQFPIQPGETPEAWTDRLLILAGAYGTYRQCSIGWHGECSQRHLGAEGGCLCVCHTPEDVRSPKPEPDLLTKCRAEVSRYAAAGPHMGDYEQLLAAGRAEFAQEIIDIIEGEAP